MLAESVCVFLGVGVILELGRPEHRVDCFGVIEASHADIRLRVFFVESSGPAPERIERKLGGETEKREMTEKIVRRGIESDS